MAGAEAAEAGKTGHRSRAAAATAVVAALLVVAASLTLGSSPSAAEDRPLPLRVPVGSTVAPVSVRVYEHSMTKVDEWEGFTYGYCYITVYETIAHEYGA